MLTELDEFMPEEAFEIIEEFGTTVGFIRAGQGAYNPATATYGGVDDAPKDIKSVPPEGYSASLIGGTADVEVGDLKFVFASLSLNEQAPTADDKIVHGGVTYAAYAVKIVKSGERDCLYEVQGRQ